MKTILMVATTIMALFAFGAVAQPAKQAQRISNPTVSDRMQGTDSLLQRVEPVEDPEITTPAAGSAIKAGEDFVVSGKAHAQSEVTVRIMPIYSGAQPPRLPPAGARAGHYQAQDFKVTTNAVGRWRIPATQVRFADGAANRKVHIFVAQTAGGRNSRGKVVEYPVTMTATMGRVSSEALTAERDRRALEQFAITAPFRLDANAGTPMTLPIGRSSGFRIQGTASPDTRVEVEIRFAGRTVEKRNSLRTTLGIPRNHVDEKITRHKNKLFGRWELTPDARGEWQTPLPQVVPYTYKIVASHSFAGIPTVRDTDEVFMDRINVVVRLVRDNRTLSEKTLTLLPII